MSRDGKRTKLTRPLQKIIPLEVVSESTHVQNIVNIGVFTQNATSDERTESNQIEDINTLGNHNALSNDITGITSVHHRPKRIPAKTGELLRRLQSSN